MPIIDPSVQAKWDETREQVTKYKSLSRRKFIWEWSLEQCLDAQNKFLTWKESHLDHPEMNTKEHIYKTYVLPRIQELTKEEN